MVDIIQFFGLGFLASLGMFLFFLSIGLYIYTSFAYMAIAKKVRYGSPGLAWIPGIGPIIIANRISKMDIWPFYIIIAFIIPFINILAILTFFVFVIIWKWKMFEAVKRPGWWILLCLIPMVGPLILLILIGIAAWGK